MDRRSLFALIAAIPAATATRASACSPPFVFPHEADIHRDQIKRLLRAWWHRDEYEFARVFSEPLEDEELIRNNGRRRKLPEKPVPANASSLFKQLFQNEKTDKKIIFTIGTEVGMFVFCSETPVGGLGTSCFGMPYQHVFIVKFDGLNPASIIHVDESPNLKPDKFNIWVGG